MPHTAITAARTLPVSRRDQAAEIVGLALRLKALIARHCRDGLETPLPLDAVDALDEALIAFKSATDGLEV